MGLIHLSCRYCAQLIKGWGGNTGSFGETHAGKVLLEDLESIRLEEVRAKVDQLLTNGYNKRESVWKSEEDLLCHFEVSTVLSVKTSETKIIVDEAANRILQHISGIRNILIGLSSTFTPYLSVLPSKNKKIKLLPESIKSLLQDMEDCQAISSDNVNHISSHFQIDSDEEARLFDEIDIMMDTQERAELFKGNTQRFLANSVECIFRRIFDLENAFRLVRSIF